MIEKLLTHLRDDKCDYGASLDAVEEELKKAQQSPDESYANLLWAVRNIVNIHHEYVNTYHILEKEEYYKAWCNAEKVEICCKNLSRNFPDFFLLVKDIYECIINLQRLYPYQLFSSYAIIIKKEKCSICGKIRSLRNDCGHRRGYVYNGEMCCNIVEECELKSIDIVDNPLHKYAVLFTVDKNQERRDNYDYSLVKGLMQYWKRPFQHWRYSIKNVHKPVTDFPGLADNSMCPCASGKKYYECCKTDPEGIKHKVFIFHVQPI